MLKYEQNRSYNGGGDAMPLKIWSDFSSLQYSATLFEIYFSFLLDRDFFKFEMFPERYVMWVSSYRKVMHA